MRVLAILSVTFLGIADVSASAPTLVRACRGNRLDLAWVATATACRTTEPPRAPPKALRTTFLPNAIRLRPNEETSVDYVIDNPTDEVLDVNLGNLFCGRPRRIVLIDANGARVTRKCESWGFCNGFDTRITLEPGTDARFRFKVSAKMVVPVWADRHCKLEDRLLPPGRYTFALDSDRLPWLSARGRLEVPAAFIAYMDADFPVLVPVLVDGGMGLAKETGDLVIPGPFEWAGLGVFNRVPVCERRDGRRACGYLDFEGAEVIPLRYELAESIQGYAAAIGERRSADAPLRYGLIDLAGERLGEARFEHIGPPRDGWHPYVIVEDGVREHGYLDEHGHRLQPLDELTEVTPFSGGVAAVRVKKRWRLINSVGAYLDRPSTRRAPRHGERLIVRRTKRGVGYADLEGKLVIAPNRAWRDAQPFVGRRAFVKKRGGWYMIDREGAIVRDKAFLSARMYPGNVGLVRYDPGLGKPVWSWVDERARRIGFTNPPP
ncbi:MAG: hypothetical protein RMA76_23775 [Deltaproteobacteria bacterium]